MISASDCWGPRGLCYANDIYENIWKDSKHATILSSGTYFLSVPPPLLIARHVNIYNYIQLN